MVSSHDRNQHSFFITDAARLFHSESSYRDHHKKDVRRVVFVFFGIAVVLVRWCRKVDEDHKVVRCRHAP